MYPKLSDLINSIFGTHLNLPIMSYGFFVSLAFLAGAYLLYLELKRKEKEGVLKATERKILIGAPASLGDLIINFIIAFYIAFKLPAAITNYSHFANDPQTFLFSSEGSVWVGLIFGALYAFYIWYRRDKAKLTPPEEKSILIHPYQITWNMVFLAAIFGIIGAKVFDQLENWKAFLADPWGSLFSFSGLTFYGGLIFAAIAVIWYGQKHGITWKNLADSFAPGLMLSYGMGRIGCQVAGDGDWGIVNTLTKPHWLNFLPDWLWSYNYPHNIINEGVPIPGCSGPHCMVLPQGVFPTPIYETIMAVILFAILWTIRKKISTPGVLFFVYLIFNGTERFLIEHIRVTHRYVFMGIHASQAELISPVLVLIGIVGWYLLEKKKKDQIVSREGQHS
ncbi:MAG: prolipoprotein diacylglyceryl transferase [Bacteroidales bacterium]|nr:prolipoprotein diacylglyceryl transferase [Bacteroidales bacterium]